MPAKTTIILRIVRPRKSIALAWIGRILPPTQTRVNWARVETPRRPVLRLGRRQTDLVRIFARESVRNGGKISARGPVFILNRGFAVRSDDCYRDAPFPVVVHLPALCGTFRPAELFPDLRHPALNAFRERGGADNRIESSPPVGQLLFSFF